ncbi:Drug/metabolite transporter, partial [Cynara cardunculus var. scolymus]
METSKPTTELVTKKMQGLKATMMMIAAQLAIAAITVAYKLAANDGMHMRIMVFYRYLFGSVIILPLALIIERNRRPKLTWRILVQAFVCAIFGGPMAQILFVESLVQTSATFASAFTNLTPPFTFIIGVLFGIEKVKIGTKGGKAKVIGTLVGVVGAMVLTFYKGHQLNIWSTHVNILHGGQHMHGQYVAATQKTSIHQTVGSLLGLASSLSIALYLSLQAIASSLSIIFITTSVHLQGPLFVSNFNPLMLVFVAIAGSLVLDEKLHVG